MPEHQEQLSIDERWKMEISRLAETLDMEIDPEDQRISSIKQVFPVFEHFMRSDPTGLMQIPDVNLDPTDSTIVDAFNKGRLITSSMLLLSLIRNQLLI